MSATEETQAAGGQAGDVDKSNDDPKVKGKRTITGIPFIIITAVAVVALTFATQGIAYKRLNILERLLFLVPVVVVFFQLPLALNLAAAGVGVFALLLSRRGRQAAVISG